MRRGCASSRFQAPARPSPPSRRSGIGGDGFLFAGLSARQGGGPRGMAEPAGSEATAGRPVRGAAPNPRNARGYAGASSAIEPVALGRELTKAHEELVVRPISAHLETIDEGRGEYTLVVSGRTS